MRQKIRAHLGRFTRVLDIHTFEYGKIKSLPHMQVGIMYQQGQRHMALALGAIFRQCLTLRWGIFGDGTTVNDILDEVLDYRVNGVLIELAENLTDVQVEEVAQCLQAWR